MDFDFLFKLVLTCSFAGVTLCLCIKWIVESYLDFIQVTTGIKVMTLAQLQEQERQQQRQEQYDDDADY